MTCFFGLSGGNSFNITANTAAEVFDGVARQIGTGAFTLVKEGTKEKLNTDSVLTEGTRFQIVKLIEPDFTVKENVVYIGKSTTKMNFFVGTKKHPLNIPDGDYDAQDLSDAFETGITFCGHDNPYLAVHFFPTPELLKYVCKPEIARLFSAISTEPDTMGMHFSIFDAILIEQGFEHSRVGRTISWHYKEERMKTKKLFLAGDADVVSEISPQIAALFKEYFSCGPGKE